MKGCRELGSLLLLVAGILAACSVDTSGITFEKDDVFERGRGAGAAGVVGNAGVLNKGGSAPKAGTDGGGSDAAGGDESNGEGGAPTAGMPSGGMPGGGMPPGGMGGMQPTCGTAKAIASQPLIDDFEDGNAIIPMMGDRRGGWYTYDDGTGMLMPPPNQAPLPAKPGASGSEYAMRLSGTGFTVFGAVIGVPFFPNAMGTACVYDVSAHQGVRFWVKGNVGTGSLRVQLATIASHQPPQGGVCDQNAAPMGMCGDHFGFSLMPTANWTHVEVTWTQMSQQGWGKEVAFDVRRAMNLEFAVGPTPSFDFWIDTVEFF